MRLASITITNLAAFKDFSATLPSVALIEGRHGAGKSSLKRIISYAFGRRPLATNSRGVEHDPSILHGNSESGSAIITFTDGDLESLRVTVKPDETTRQIKVRGKKSWQAAGSGIDDITSALAYDPMQFNDLDPKDRLEAFLRASPVDITHAEIIAAVGEHVDLPEKPGLDTINALHDAIYKLRTTENTAVTTQETYAAQLYAALPPAAESGDWNTEVVRLRADKAVLEASEAEEVKRIGGELQAAKDAAGKVQRADEMAIDRVTDAAIAAFDKQIREIENQKTSYRELVSDRKQALFAVEASAIETARTKANAEVTELRTNNAPLHESLTSQIATADERARSAAQAEGTREAAATARAEAANRRSKAQKMTESLKRLIALKAEAGSRMKIPGVTIAAPREGQPVDICREENGALIPFSSWNSAAQDQFCLKVAILFRGTCGLVCVDSMANWSPARQAAFLSACRKYAADSGMQFLIGKALDEGELAVVDATEVPA